MPLEAPTLDTRTFEDLLREAQLRIPRYLPEWTDFNDSDPGMTLVQLFCWLTEMMLYQMNRVPERNYIKFLQLVGLDLRAAQAAVAHLTFVAQPNATVVPSVLPGSRVQGQPPGGEAVTFETQEGVDLIRVPLTDLQVSDGTSFDIVTKQNLPAADPFRPFGWVPRLGSALYLGFDSTNVPNTVPFFPQVMRFRVFLPAPLRVISPELCSSALQSPPAPVDLVWECRDSKDRTRWRRLTSFTDETAALTREGYILVQGPRETFSTTEGKVTEPRIWLRCRLLAGAYPAGREPLIDFLRPNTTPAIHLSTVRDELVAESDGTPNQVIRLRHRPVYKGSLDLYGTAPGSEEEPWEAREDFFASNADDPHYVVNLISGEIQFGDGSHGRIPPAGTELVARIYRYGGGTTGNVQAGLVNTLMTSVTGVESVINERRAEGGRDEQDVEELKQQAPHMLRCRNRAVTKEDFIALAAQAGGVARATAVPLAHPDHPGVAVPGAITVVIVPDSDDVPPRPSPELLTSVCRYLNDFRLLTTEVYVKGPEYQAVRVEALVAAQPHAAFDVVATNVRQALNLYMSPLGRAPGGAPIPQELSAVDRAPWEFGEELYPSNLYGVIREVKDVKAVLSMKVFINGVPSEDIRQVVTVPVDGLVFGAEHAITVVPAQDL
ncbi:MAG: putative baseplate assembly protein [Deltaproteobacteria bacterium]|nr:putative baseplate assembly protein [Deltaproteobacteria bacterium]